RHILRHDGGTARDEARHMAGQRASVDVISATGAVADVKIDRLALVKVRRTLRVTERDRTKREDRRGATAAIADHIAPFGPDCEVRKPCGTPEMRTSGRRDPSKLSTFAGSVDYERAACAQAQIRQTDASLTPSWGMGPDRAGATLGRTATATILPGNPVFAIDTVKTRAGENNVDENSRGAVWDLLLPGCGRPGSVAELSQPFDQDDRAVSTGRPDRHHGPTGCARSVDQAWPGGGGRKSAGRGFDPRHESCRVRRSGRLHAAVRIVRLARRRACALREARHRPPQAVRSGCVGLAAAARLRGGAVRAGEIRGG